MKKFFLNYILFPFLLFFGLFSLSHAEIASSTSLINAEILSNVWYSTTTISEGENINIYAGFQNHSLDNLSGTVGFYIDDIQISKSNFIANPKSLIKFEANYKPVRGVHTAQAKILDIAEEGINTNKLSIDNLLSKQTEKDRFSVSYKIEVIDKKPIDKVEDVALNIKKSIDNEAESLATQLESYKKPIQIISDINEKTNQLTQGKTSGTVIKNSSSEKNNKTESGTPITNTLIDAGAFVIRKWMYSFATIIAVILFIVFK